jgi:UDP-N-acetylmuramyl pentapeptide synthase
MIIHQTLSQFLSPQKIYTSPQNFNGELGLTLSIFMIESFPPHLGSYLRLIVASFRRGLTRRKKYDIIVLEYGIDRPGEMQFLLSIARPHIGIITKLDKVHTQQFGDPDTLAHEELLMLKKTKHIVILNDEESYCHTIAEKLKHTKEIFWYTTKKPEKTEIPEDNIVFSVYHAKIIKQRDQIMSNFLCKIGKKRLEVTTNMVEHQNYGYIAV